MKRAVGPLDRRKRVTRCVPCANRRIKCEGGLPCHYCIRHKKSCLPQRPSSGQIVFVTEEQAQHSIERQIQKPTNVLYLDYFALFTQRCQITAEFATVTPDLLPLMETSPPLQSVVQAIGALEASRRCSIGTGVVGKPLIHAALKSYGDSLRTLYPLLQLEDAVCRQDVIWSTFLLGLFELLSDTSGEQWTPHMLYGTSRMFQLADPTTRLSEWNEKLIAAFKTLEVNRVIMYGGTTVLYEQNRLEYHPLPQKHSSNLEGWILGISSFSNRLFEQVEAIPEALRHGHPVMHALAHEGTRLQQRLGDWHRNLTTQCKEKDSRSKLALMSYHALQLYLSKNFTYYSCWYQDTAPSLTEPQIETHVSQILDLSKAIMDHSSVPGLLLLFPLRMAGGNAVNTSQKDTTLRLLSLVAQQGFIVSDRIRIDLVRLWRHQSSQDVNSM